jgi:hypothetical protein
MRLFCFAMATLALAADWPGKAFPDWSDDTVLKVLTNSPWTRARTVRLEWTKRDPGKVDLRDIPGAIHQPANVNQGAGPLGGIGRGRNKASLPDRAEILVRWAGALPVRQATALYRLREEKLPPDQLNALIGVPEQYAIVEIFGLPAGIAHQGTAVVEDIARRSATLRVGNSGAPGQAVKAEAKLDSAGLTIRLHFERTPALMQARGDIEFAVDMQIFEVREWFRTTNMRYRGALEL